MWTLSYCVLSSIFNSSKRNGRQWHFSPDTTDWKHHHEEGFKYYIIVLPSPTSHFLFSPPSPLAHKGSREAEIKYVRKKEIKRITALVFTIRWKIYRQVQSILLVTTLCFSFLLTLCKDWSYTDLIIETRVKQSQAQKLPLVWRLVPGPWAVLPLVG